MILAQAVAFSLLAPSGGRFGVTDLGRRTTAVFAFCSCAECRAVARRWSATPQAKRIRTVGAFLDDVKASPKFLRSTGLAQLGARLGIDEDGSFARDLHALPCPTAYVIDARGELMYSSKRDRGPLSSSPAELTDDVLRVAQTGKPIAIRPPEPVLPSVRLAPVRTSDDRIDPEGVLESSADANDALPHRRFRFRNATKAPIEIGNTAGSCGCGAVTLWMDGRKVTNPRVRPGEEIDMEIAWTPAGRETKRSFTGWIYSRTNVVLATARVVLR